MTVLVAALACAGVAGAQQVPPTRQSQVEPTQSPAAPPGARPDTPPPASLQFKAMDRNNDGLVSSGEFDDVAKAMFDAMDGDHDDSVTLEEMEHARRKLDARAPVLSAEAAARKIRAIDTSADGVLSRTEHRDAAAKLFQQADQDSDGNLTTQEFDATYAEVIASLAA
jgi:Ca2+-binding EF-hand superfamily protein